MRRCVWVEVAKAILTVPKPMIPDHSLDTDKLGIFYEPIRDLVTIAIVSIAILNGDPNIDRSPDGMNRELGRTHLSAVLSTTIYAEVSRE